MPDLNVVFEVPKWVEAGVKAGDLQIFGGVVRDSAGRIVYMLRQVGRSVPRFGRGRLVIVVLAVAAVAGGAYFAYRRFTRKGKALGRLESLETAMITYLTRAERRELTREDVEALSAALATFLDHLRSSDFGDAKVTIPVDVHEKLQEFLSSLRAFNAAAHDRTHSLPGPPPSITDGSLLVLLENLQAQLRYQEMALVARPEDPPNLALERSGSVGRSAP